MCMIKKFSKNTVKERTSVGINKNLNKNKSKNLNKNKDNKLWIYHCP